MSTEDEGGYKGPAILSTAGYPIGRYLGRPISFQWHVGIHGTYSSDLTPAATDSNGELVKYSSAGAFASFGGSGVRHGKDDTLSADFRVGYRVYSSQNPGFSNGVDLAAGLGYARQIDLRTAMQARVHVSTTGYSWGGFFTPTVEIPIDGIPDPADEGFDSRRTSVGLSAGINRMLTQRWGVNAGASTYYTDRKNKSLISSNGWSARGGMSYVLNASSTTGAQYGVSHYRSPDGFGQTWSHSLSWVYSKTFENQWAFSGYAGAFYAEFDRLQAVPLDPLLAAIIGRPAVLEPFFETRWGPSLGATLSRGFRESSISFYYRRGIRPGSSFYPSSESDNGGVSYSLTTTRRSNLGLGARFSYNRAPGGDFTHTSYGARAGWSYRLRYGLHLTTMVSYATQDITGGNLNRGRLFASVGLTWGSGSTTVSLF